MSESTSDIIIAGGGLVGNALALALAKGGLHVTVIEPLPRESQLNAGFDGRTSAIAAGSVRILDHCGVWANMKDIAQPIHDIRVCEAELPGFVHYSDREIGEPFGYILENNLLRRGIYLALEAASNITILTDKVTGFARGEGSITARLESGKALSAPLLVAADGRFSGLRAQAGLASRNISYEQTAIVCTIEHELPHHGLAVEKFYTVGPFAVLPLSGNRSGIVWTESTEDAPQYVALSDAEFDAEVQRRLGDAATCVWGKARAVGKRFAYPLVLMHAEDFVAERFALIGDAAHGIHPIAGQGVNLGYRDVAVLAQLLVEQKKLGRDLGDAALLARYQRWRRFDSVSMTAATDGLNRLFRSKLPGMSLLRRAGMSAVNRVPPAKRFLMRHAMGLIGDLPNMMQPPSPSGEIKDFAA